MSIKEGGQIPDAKNQKHRLPEVEVTPAIDNNNSKLKATPESGYKEPRAKHGEVCIGHRVYGDVDIFSKPKNFNFNLRRDNEENMRFRIVKFFIVLSFVPIGFLLYNAENKFRDAGVKQVSTKRRIRLDQEHGVDREQMIEDYQKLDDFYRHSEKKEIEKYQRIGKTATDYYEQKEMRAENDDQKAKDEMGSENTMKALLLKKKDKQGIEVREIQGDGYTQTEISQKADTKDPRVGGTRIIFDTRLSDVSQSTDADELTAYMKVKNEEKKKLNKNNDPAYQRKMLQQMMDQERAERDLHMKQKYGEKEVKSQDRGFQRKNQDSRSVRPHIPGSGGPPASALSNDDEIFYDIESDSQLTQPLLETIERYNLIMKFMKRSCTSESQRQLCSILVTKLIPDLDSLDFNSIENMLTIIEDGMKRYEDDSSSTDFKSGQILEHYVKLKLTKSNVELMIQNAIETYSSKKVSEQKEVEYSLSYRINHELTDKSEELKKLKNYLQIYNNYKKELKQFKNSDDVVRAVSKDIMPAVEKKGYLWNEMVHDTGLLIDQFELNKENEFKFIQMIMNRIHTLEMACMKQIPISDTHPMSSRSIFVRSSVRQDENGEFKHAIEPTNEYLTRLQQLQGLQEKEQLPYQQQKQKNEFTKPLEDILYVRENVTKLKPFYQGIDNIINYQESVQMVQRCQQFFGGGLEHMKGQVAGQALSNAQQILPYIFDNIKQVQNLMQKDLAWQKGSEAREMSNLSNQAAFVDGDVAKVKNILTNKHQEYIKQIMEHGTPSKKEIINDVRKYFEGPINTNQLIYSQFKNFNKDRDEGKLESAGENLAIILDGSYDVIELMNDHDDFEGAYAILRDKILPIIEQTMTKPMHVQQLKDIIFKIETHVFALRLFKQMKDQKSSNP